MHQGIPEPGNTKRRRRCEELSRKDLMGCASLHPSYGSTGGSFHGFRVSLRDVKSCYERFQSRCVRDLPGKGPVQGHLEPFDIIWFYQGIAKAMRGVIGHYRIVGVSARYDCPDTRIKVLKLPDGFPAVHPDLHRQVENDGVIVPAGFERL